MVPSITACWSRTTTAQFLTDLSMRWSIQYSVDWSRVEQKYWFNPIPMMSDKKELAPQISG
jgi:hypothetical protein